MPDYYTGYYDESRLRGIPSPMDAPNMLAPSSAGNYSAPYSGLSPDGVTPLLINQGTYTNGRTFAGTGNRSNPGGGNVRMSDQAYNLLMSNLGQIPTDRDVLGGGQFGIRGWLRDHPEAVVISAPLLAYGGSLLAGGAAAGAGAGASGAASGAGGLTTMTAAEQAAITAGLTNVPAGIGAGTAAGAAGAGAGSLAGFGGAGTAGAPANLAADFAGTQAGAAGNGLVLSGGAGTGVPGWMNGISGAGAAGAGGGGGGAAGALGGSMGWGDWVNLAGQLYGAYSEGQGAKDASRAANAGIQAGIAEQARQYDTSRADQMPWLQAGTAALGRLQDPASFTTSPGYNFVRGEGQRDIGNSFAARGGAASGNALRALTQYNQNLASQEYNNWFNQQSNLAGLGQTSAQSLGALGQNSANNVSNFLSQQGANRASGIEGQTNALTGGISDFLAWYNRRKQPSYGGAPDYGGWS